MGSDEKLMLATNFGKDRKKLPEGTRMKERVWFLQKNKSLCLSGERDVEHCEGVCDASSDSIDWDCQIATLHVRRVGVNFEFKLATRIAWGTYPVDGGKYPMQQPIEFISQVRITRLKMIDAVREIRATRQ